MSQETIILREDIAEISIKYTHQQTHQFYHMSEETKVHRDDTAVILNIGIILTLY